MDCYLASRIPLAMFALAALALSPEHQSAIICSFFGAMGGGLANCLTYDDRKPTKKYLVGDIFSSGVFGLGTYVALKASTVDVIFYSILAGAAGSGMFLVLVSRFKPAWLDRLSEGGHDHDATK
jgi:hypothetical protein